MGSSASVPVTVRERDMLLVARRWASRSRHTSVERFLAFFPSARILSGDQALKRPYRLLKAVAARAGQDGYTSLSAGIEAAAWWQMVRFRPRLVHFLYADHDYHYFGRLAGCKLAGTFWFSVEEFERRMPDKRHLRNLHLVTASGRAQMAYLAQFVAPERLAYLPLGVDAAFFTPGDQTERQTTGLHLLQVGVNRRDFELLAAVWRGLKQVYPALRLDMVGCRSAGPLFEGDPAVVFHPFVDDGALRALYRRAALMILPLHEGGSSNALNEALACGLPVVATRLPNVEDYADEACVALCPPGDARAMLAACRRWLDDPAGWRQASLAARQHALQFDWPVIRTRLLALYEQYLGLRVVAEGAAHASG